MARGRVLRGGGRRAHRAGRAERPDLAGQRGLHGHRRVRRRAAACCTCTGRSPWCWWRAAVAAAAGGAVVGVAAARLRGPYLAGATLMLAVALPSLALRFGLFGGDQGLTVVITSPGFLGAGLPGHPLAGLADLRLRADRPGAAGQPGPQPGRAVLAGRRGRRGGGRPGGPERGPAPGAGLRGQRGLRRPGGRAARRDHVDHLAGRVHPDAVHRPAHRRGAGRPGHPARRGVGQPRAGPGPDLRHRHGQQPRPVQLGRVQHPGRGLRRRAHRRHARLPRRHPGWPAPAEAGRPWPPACPRRAACPWRRAPGPQLHVPASEHQEEGSI